MLVSTLYETWCTHCQPNVDHVNNNVFTKYGFNKSIRSQITKQKTNSDVYQGL